MATVEIWKSSRDIRDMTSQMKYSCKTALTRLAWNAKRYKSTVGEETLAQVH